MVESIKDRVAVFDKRLVILRAGGGNFEVVEEWLVVQVGAVREDGGRTVDYLWKTPEHIDYMNRRFFAKA